MIDGSDNDDEDGKDSEENDNEENDDEDDQAREEVEVKAESDWMSALKKIDEKLMRGDGGDEERGDGVRDYDLPIRDPWLRADEAKVTLVVTEAYLREVKDSRRESDCF